MNYINIVRPLNSDELSDRGAEYSLMAEESYNLTILSEARVVAEEYGEPTCEQLRCVLALLDSEAPHLKPETEESF